MSADANDAQVNASPIEGLVSIATDKVVADSRVVAAKFRKDHKNVLRAIDDLAARLSRVGGPMAQNSALGFVENRVARPNAPNRFDRYYEMDRDAFALLAMGFTGEEALQWKLEYINAFNAMETQLKTQTIDAPSEIDLSVRWIKQILSEPGRYRINVFPEQEPVIYKTNFDFAGKEHDQLVTQLLGRLIQTIANLWEQLRLQQSFFLELKNDVIVTNLDVSIRQADRLAAHFLHFYAEPKN
jgi:Rha family phage regulatory protein